MNPPDSSKRATSLGDFVRQASTPPTLAPEHLPSVVLLSILEDTTMKCRTLGLLVTLAAAVQPTGKVPKIGLLSLGSATATARNFEAFKQALHEFGYIEGQNLAIEQRYADGRPERLPALAAELAALHVAVFVVNVNSVAEAVQQTTTQIPIVMINAEEPVGVGLVKSLARPGGNITGLTIVARAEIYGKNLEMLTEALPQGARIGVLFNATSSVNALWLHATGEAARGLGVTLVLAGVRSAEDFEHAFAVMAHGHATGFAVLGEPLFFSAGNSERINELAVRNGLASMWPIRQGAERGGLRSYGTNTADLWRRAATCRWSSP